MLKGQVEFIVILGIIAVAVVAIYYALPAITTPAAPPAVAAEQQAVKETVNNFIKTGTIETLKTLGSNGGWPEPQYNSVTYLGRYVPYWFSRGSLNTPNLQQNFVTVLTDYLRTHKDSLAESLAGKGVTFGDPSVSANILGNQIIVNVNMPTTVKEYPIAQPYSVTVQSKAGEVYEFANNFVRAVGTERYFEYFTLSSMMMSEIDEGVRRIPFMIILTDCGESVFKTWDDVQPAVKEAILDTLGGTYLPGKEPQNVARTTSTPKFVVPGVNGKTYSDIDVSFYLPDNFELGMDNFQMDPSPIMIMTEPLGFTGICASEPVVMKYYLSYPVVTEAKDPITGTSLKFAFDVLIKDNAPADYGAVGYAPPEPTICAGSGCSANIKIVDSNGAAIPGARIFFGGCNYKADSRGIYQGPIPCVISSISVTASGYGELAKTYSFSELYDATLALKSIPVVNLHFHEVSILNNSMHNQYAVYQNSIRPMNNDLRPSEKMMMSFTEIDRGKPYIFMFNERTGTIDNIPADTYYVVASLMKGDMTERYGASAAVATLDEGTNNLHIYVPYMYEFTQYTEEQASFATAIVNKVFEKCGIPVVSSSSISLSESCFVDYGEV